MNTIKPKTTTGRRGPDGKIHITHGVAGSTGKTYLLTDEQLKALNEPAPKPKPKPTAKAKPVLRSSISKPAIAPVVAKAETPRDTRVVAVYVDDDGRITRKPIGAPPAVSAMQSTVVPVRRDRLMV